MECYTLATTTGTLIVIVVRSNACWAICHRISVSTLTSLPANSAITSGFSKDSMIVQRASDAFRNCSKSSRLLRSPTRKLKTYSGGMKRRIGIAQALLNDPQLLIVDEPTAGLDPEERIRFRNLLSDLGGDRTILLSTHIVEDIAQTCRNLAILKNGRVVFQGTTGDLIGEARGRVWIVTSQGQRPTGNITIVSTLHMGDSVQYRVVGELDKPDADGVAPTEPSLEDSYVWLM